MVHSYVMLTSFASGGIVAKSIQFKKSVFNSIILLNSQSYLLAEVVVHKKFWEEMHSKANVNNSLFIYNKTTIFLYLTSLLLISLRNIKNNETPAFVSIADLFGYS